MKISFHPRRREDQIPISPLEIGTNTIRDFEQKYFEDSKGGFIELLGPITWHGDPNWAWRCVANVNGALCVILVSLWRIEDEREGSAEAEGKDKSS